MTWWIYRTDHIYTRKTPDHQVRHADGTIEEIFATHTYNESQIGWFKAGSALNLIRQYQQ